MTEHALHSPPPLTAVLRRQFSFFGRHPRRLVWLGAMTFGAVVFGGATFDVTTDSLAVGWSAANVLSLLVGAAWAVIVWQDERPDQRDYHRSLPVQPVLHDLARVTAGAAWLFPASLVMAAATLLRSATGGPVNPITFLTTTIAPMAVYLLSSIPATRSNHPIRWIAIGAVTMLLAIL